MTHGPVDISRRFFLGEGPKTHSWFNGATGVTFVSGKVENTCPLVGKPNCLEYTSGGFQDPLGPKIPTLGPRKECTNVIPVPFLVPGSQRSLGKALLGQRVQNVLEATRKPLGLNSPLIRDQDPSPLNPSATQRPSCPLCWTPEIYPEPFKPTPLFKEGRLPWPRCVKERVFALGFRNFEEMVTWARNYRRVVPWPR